MFRFCAAILLAAAVPVSAQTPASIEEMARTPLVRVNIAETLRTPPDEASLTVGGETLLLRPTFGALVAAEQELGPLFALVERAAEGRLALGDIAALFDRLSPGRPAAITRDRIGEAVVEMGLAKVSPVLRIVLGQILQGR